MCPKARVTGRKNGVSPPRGRIRLSPVSALLRALANLTPSRLRSDGAPQEEEAICLELGNKTGLAYCYWNWGLLERTLGNSAAEQTKLAAALALFRELGMPRERDAVEAELAKSRAAGTA